MLCLHSRLGSDSIFHLATCNRARGRDLSIGRSTFKVQAAAPSQDGELPASIRQARQVRLVGLLASAAFLGAGVTAAFWSGLPVPVVVHPPKELPAAVLLGLVALDVAVAAAAASQGDRLQVEVHKGQLYVQWGTPSSGPSLAPGAVEVRPTGDIRGNGAFATQPIPKGTYLGDYEGDMLSEVAFWQRYPDGVSDYGINIDRDWVIDGQQRAADTSAFSPCHINHSATRYNVVRSTKRAERRVSFYTRRDIKAGEELLLDYGRTYWTGRPDQELS